jgi:phosphatidylinositol glycan class T
MLLTFSRLLCVPSLHSNRIPLSPEHRLYRLTIPRLSAACTESLTPFLSLLPCSSRAGLSSLLNPHRLFDGEFTSIAVSMLKDESEGTVRFELRIGSVQDPVRLDRLTGQLGRRGESPLLHQPMASL